MEVEESSEYWQKQCSLLYRELNKNLTSGSIEPVISECDKDQKVGADALFHILLASGITLKAFDRAFDVLKTWLEYRNSAKVTLKYEDGSTIELTHRTKSEALELMEKHQQKIKE